MLIKNRKTSQQFGINLAKWFRVGFVFLFSFSFVLIPRWAIAANSSLYFDGPKSKLGIGSEFQVRALVSSDQALNAYKLSLYFPADKLELLGFNNAGSIVDVSQTEPEVLPGGDVRFAGGSLKPFLGQAGLLMILNFKARAQGEAEIVFGDSSVYLANGKGTKVVPEIKGLKLGIADKLLPGPGIPLVSDTQAPQVEEFVLVRDPITEGQRLISFVVRDSDSGVNKVELRLRRWLWWSSFEPALNPTVISAKVWSVNLKVTDNSHNVSERVIYDWRVFLEQFLPVLIAVSVLIVLVINRLLRRKIIYN